MKWTEGCRGRTALTPGRSRSRARPMFVVFLRDRDVDLKSPRRNRTALSTRLPMLPEGPTLARTTTSTGGARKLTSTPERSSRARSHLRHLGHIDSSDRLDSPSSAQRHPRARRARAAAASRSAACEGFRDIVAPSVRRCRHFQVRADDGQRRAHLVAGSPGTTASLSVRSAPENARRLGPAAR